VAGVRRRCAPTSSWMRSSRRSITAVVTTLAGLVHHRDRGTQYLSMRYTARVADEGFMISVLNRPMSIA
jgi:transposase InsO family protein